MEKKLNPQIGFTSQLQIPLTMFVLFRTQNVLGEKGRRIRELTAVVQKRFGFPEGSVEVSGVSLFIVSFSDDTLK